jgi:cell pole-organizing protein PopZ
MSQAAKAAQEPSMEEILASIRRIIADDEAKAKPPEPPKPAPVAAPPPPRPVAASPKPPPPPPPPPPRAVAPPPPPPPAASQDEIDAMLSGLGDAQDANAAPDDGVADVLDLTESMAAPAPQPPVFRTVESQADVFFTEESSEPPPAPPRLDDLRRPPALEESPLLSSAASAAVDAAFNTLAHTVLTQNARTLEDLVKDMMRPMLKAWLDDNLPGLVERIVRAEIERVSRGRS